MKRFLVLFILAAVWVNLQAQPAKRRTTPTTVAGKGKGATVQKPAEKKSDRAALMFPTSAEMPEDVVWRRDIYRQLDLMKDANAPLYYPVEPHGKDQNLFTYLFRLMLSGRIPAYQYKLDGNESFEEKDKADVKELLDRYSIYYEEKDGKITVPESDIPSPEVTRYYIKESSYFDQRSATYKTRVTALCPVLMRGTDFNDVDAAATPYPLFWMKYDDVASYLSRLPLMASNLNNVTNMTADDYFTLNRYEGKIYKTNNMQGRVLSNYCKNDTAMKAEQARIEQQLADFEKSIWHKELPEDSVDSDELLAKAVKSKRTSKAKVAKASATTDSTQVANEEVAQEPVVEKKAKVSARRSESSSSRRSSSSTKTKQPKSSGGSSAPRVSARRQRR